MTVMTELSFAKSFLSTLDSRSVKLQADYVADPKNYEPKGPVCPIVMTKPHSLNYVQNHSTPSHVCLILCADPR